MLPLDGLVDIMLSFNRFTDITLASGDYVMLQLLYCCSIGHRRLLCFNSFTAIKLASGDYVMLQYFTAIKGAITLVILG